MKAAAPLRPSKYTEQILLTSILNGIFAPGTSLPNERKLAEEIGVTRPTLRETLQRLANEGWIRIQHGKPTTVNNYWETGGLSLLSTLAKYGQHLPNGFITHLLEVRVTLLPPIARLAAAHHPDAVMDYLSGACNLQEQAEPFAIYDWDLQILMARHSRNPIFPLILNDFALLFKTMARRYFKHKEARRTSRAYYKQLFHGIMQGSREIESIVGDAMQKSIAIWQEVKS